jgi:hypothetical protein
MASDFRSIREETFAAAKAASRKAPAAPKAPSRVSPPSADPQAARKIYRVRDAQAVTGDGADERMDRPGRSVRAKGGRVGGRFEERPNRLDDGEPTRGGGREFPSRAAAYSKPGPATVFAAGGAVAPKPGPAWREGMRNRTPVQHNSTGKNDQNDVGRGRPITYRRGGRVGGRHVED